MTQALTHSGTKIKQVRKYLHFSPGFLRLHSKTAMIIAMISKTMEATIMVTIMITFDVPIVFKSPTPKNDNIIV